jgi:hypothetical protein
MFRLEINTWVVLLLFKKKDEMKNTRFFCEKNKDGQ